MYSFGIDIGGTKCAVVLGKDRVGETPEGFIIDKLSFPTNASRGWREVVAEILARGDDLLLKNGVEKSELLGVGISCGGPLDSKNGTVNCPPNLPDWDNVPIVKLVSAHFGVRAVLQNDANACAVAEWRFGAGRGYNNLVFLTFGTGMGAGLILDGRLYSGATDMAGEVGHIRLTPEGPLGYGKSGSFEGYCSGLGLKNLAYIIAQKHIEIGLTSSLFTTLEEAGKITAKSLAQAREQGDKFANAVFSVCAERLGGALALLCDVLNPEAIILGSIYERNSEFFEPIVSSVIEKEALAQTARACKILPAKLGDGIGDYAALGLLF